LSQLALTSCDQLYGDIPDNLEIPSEKPKQDEFHRRIYDMKSTRDYDKAILCRSEGDDEYRKDDSVDKCYNNIGIALEFFSTVFGRRSVDGHGMEIIAWLHYARHWPQAMWLKSKKFMIVGDGFADDPNNPSSQPSEEKIYFGNFAASIDSIAHELVHGITNATAQLEYKGQSGALNESISDVFASMIRQRHLRQTVDKADWLIAQDAFLPEQRHMALRSLKSPGKAFYIPNPSGSEKPILKDMQVAHMSQFKAVPDEDDHGGVHVYSGIPNHAFYLAATKVGGLSWENVGEVWYLTLTKGNLTPSCTFIEFAKETVRIASTLQSNPAEAIQSAWNQVGVHW
jgi:Zn-dependent metalloprotease